MTRKRIVLIAAMGLAALATTTACDDSSGGDGGGDGSADNGDSVGDEDGDGDADGDGDGDGDGETFPTTGDGDGDGDDCGSFLGCDDMPMSNFCDFWAQDCPDGEKCTSIASDPSSGAWDAFVCVPEGSEPPGSACQGGDGPQGTDTCDKTGMCYDVDAETGIGTCVEFCQAPESAPTCPQSGASYW